MDQDSGNGAGADKRNWRERLGIGAKELPKLSDEFREEAPASSAPPPAAGTAKPAPRAPQPVTKPAPMAPRSSSAKPTGDNPAAAPAAAAAPVSRATPKAPDNATQDALAEKLRAQRAAAERLAEQRVQAARNRAESKPKADAPPPRPAAPPPPRGAAPATPRAAGSAPAAGRPKFSFADDSRGETAPRAGLGSPAPLSPPRPALGGERGQPPFLRPSQSANGSLGARPQPAFRPSSDGATSGYLAPPRLQAPGASRAGLGSEAAGYGAARVPARRPPPPALDPYAGRQADARDYPDDDYQDDGRSVPRLGRPAVGGRGRALQEDYDEVFEDEQVPQRGRPGARDYESEYSEGEDGFADEPRRSSGPWLLLLALLAAAVLTGALVWFYSDNMKNLAGGSGASSSGSGTTPVVVAPSDPAKVAAPDAGNADGQTEAPAARKKQIYDRIVGEQEVSGQVQPTEETPVPPSDAPADGSAQPADQVPKVEPMGSTNAIPAPDAPSQGATGQGGLPEVEPPPPLPIPGSDTQGNLGLKGTQQVVSATPGQMSTAPPPPPGTPQPSSSDATLPPPPEKATDGAALVSGGGSGGQSGSASATVTPQSDADAMQLPKMGAPEPDTQATPPAPSTSSQSASSGSTPPKKKPATAKKNTASQPDYNNLGSKPVVLVPPSKEAVAASQVAPPAPELPATANPVTQGQAPANPAATAQKRKSIFDLFNGSGTSTTTTTPPTQVASAAQQTKQTATATQKAVTPPAATPAPAPPPAAASPSGYVIQLASFKTESEARAEYSRLAKAYPSLVSPLKSQIRQTTVGGSTRYQLGLGPLPTRGDATKVCGELIADGESDCIVRGP